MTDDRMNPDLITEMLDMLDRHGSLAVNRQ